MSIDEWLSLAKPLLANVLNQANAASEKECLQQAVFETEIILSETIQKNRSYLRSHGEVALNPLTSAAASKLLQSRCQGYPIAYLFGSREFFGRDFICTADTLIPRPDTETLIEYCLDLPVEASNPKVLDLGTGTGAIGITLKLEKPDWQLHCLDIANATLAVAKHNAAKLGAEIDWLVSDWFSALNDQQKFDLIISNPPYVEDQHELLEQGDVRFEPKTALISGSDGLDDIRQLIHTSPNFLQTNSWLVLEHGYQQHESIQQLLQQRGFEQIETIADLGGNPRVTSGQWKS